MSSSDYAREKLELAMHSLAVSAASIQERLRNVAVSHLAMLGREDFDGCPRSKSCSTASGDALTAVGGEGSFAASTAAMSDEQAVAVARDIAELRVWMTLRSDM